jgi:hypothetical protein
VRGEDAPVRARLFRPKSEAGTRTIEIPLELVAVLKSWKLECPPTGEGYPFRSSVAAEVSENPMPPARFERTTPGLGKRCRTSPDVL